MTITFGEILGKIHVDEMTETEKTERIKILKDAISIKKKRIEEFTIEKEKYINGDDVVRAMETGMSNLYSELKCLEMQKLYTGMNEDR